MSEQQQARGHHDDTWLDEWDRTPRDGPAVFVLDTATFDRYGTRWGRWLDPTQEPAEVRSELVEAIGTDLVDNGDWAVVDQVGLGSEMLPEEVSIDALVRIARDRIGGRS